MTTSSPQSLSTHYTEKLSRNATALSSLFLLPAVSQATIIQSSSSLTISIEGARWSSYQPVDWDVDGNSVADFRLEAFRDIFYTGSGSSSLGGGYGYSIPFGRLELNSAGSNQSMVEGAGGVSNLALGATVGPTLDAGLLWGANANRVMMSSSSYFGFPTGNIYDTGFIGFSFLGDTNQTLYGWAQITLDSNTLDMTIDQWAYETNGGSIQVGAVPLPPSALLMLSGLALGAGGVLRGRKARQAAQEQAAETAS